MRDSSDIDAALLAHLGSDPTLLALCPNGVYFDEAAAGSTRFVIVGLADTVDVPMQGPDGHRAIEDTLYMVEARMLSTAGGDIKAAAKRIDELLEDYKLQAPGSPGTEVSGYAWMSLSRESRIRLIERDEIDPTIRWFRRGGHYRLMMSCE
jgi:hypothetical protein